MIDPKVERGVYLLCVIGFMGAFLIIVGLPSTPGTFILLGMLVLIWRVGVLLSEDLK